MLVIVDVGDSVAIDSITKLGRQLASHAGKEETGRHLPSPQSTRSGRSRSRENDKVEDNFTASIPCSGD